jgi:hypothetical protein
MFARYGHLALQVIGRDLPLQVLESAAGFYLGTADDEGPVSRESQEYFGDFASAQQALKTGSWTQRDKL